VSGECTGDNAIRAIAPAGTVSCQPTGTGTVTSVGSGTGLIGGPVTSSGSLSLAPGYRLPQGCAAAQIASWNGSAWDCGADQDSGGDITAITTSGGLTGGGSSGAVSLGVDAAQIQSRVGGACAAGTALRSIAQSGTVACGTTTPSGTAGGALKGGYPNPELDVAGGPCPNGQALTNVAANASLTCSIGVYYGTSNLVVAPEPPASLTSGELNSGFGVASLRADTTGSDNSALGAFALRSNSTGSGNSALGAYALYSNVQGGSNTAVGDRAMTSNSIGSLNSALGKEALYLNTAGGDNSALGGLALYSNTTGNYNSAVGVSSLFKNASGYENAALGYGALRENTNGYGNSAVGVRALNANSSGYENTALGQFALAEVTFGHDNIGVGRNAGLGIATGSYNVDIGSQGIPSDTGTIRIGEGAHQQKTFIAGISGTTTGGAASPVLVDSSGQLGTTSSSRRFKRDIHRLGRRAAAALMKLRPVSFRYKRGFTDGDSSPLQYGLIAEQVAKVYPSLVVYGKDGRPSAVAYQELPALLLAQAQRQQHRVHRLRSRLRRQARRNARQQRQIDGLMRHARLR
jgi:hypothetical protein